MALPTAIVTTVPGTIARSTLAPATFTQLGSAGSTPGTGGVAIAAWAWTRIDVPVGSAAAFSSAVVAAPTLDSLDTYGNYLVFLVVTDDVGGVSETDWRKAPVSAFGLVKVTDDVYGTNLQKPAAGERNWHTAEREVIEYVVTLKQRLDALIVQDLTDVASATTDGPALDRLTDGSFATSTGLSGGLPMHYHDGFTVTVATAADLGVVELAEAPVDPGHPKAVTQDRFTLTALIDHSDQGAGWGTTVGKIGPFGSTTTNASQAIAAWWHTEDYQVDIADLVLADAGTIAGGGYEFGLYKVLVADFDSNTYAIGDQIAFIALPAPAADNAPRRAVAVLGDAMDARYLLVLRCLTAPVALADQGGRLNVLIQARKLW